MLKHNFPSVIALAALVFLWQLICMSGWIPPYMLPSPVKVLQAFVSELPLLWENSLITLQEAFIGLFLGVAVGFLAAVLMDEVEDIKKCTQLQTLVGIESHNGQRAKVEAFLYNLLFS